MEKPYDKTCGRVPYNEVPHNFARCSSEDFQLHLKTAVGRYLWTLSLKTDLWHTPIVQVLTSSITKGTKCLTENHFKLFCAEDLKKCFDNA